ncbi:MAG TPA: S8 family serine peptidase [Kofleriaceae bacterium]
MKASTTLSLAFSLATVGTANAAPAKLVRSPAGVPDQYIVMLKGAPAIAAIDRADLAATVDRLAADHGATVRKRYDAALRGFSARMTDAQAEALAQDPAVELVVQDTPVYASAIQANATWGLDRIDQSQLPLDSKFVGFGDGAGVTVYVIDTGLRVSHGEFAGRVLPGAYAIEDGQQVNDCNGHGSHVAGTVAGSTWGVAKQAKIVPVRVLGCDGSGSVEGVIAGINWVTQNKLPNSVANLSLGGPVNAAQDTAIRNLVNAGVTVVVAAGNSNADACTQSPAREPLAITVGATAQTDARASFSNFGSCVDVFAPGVAIMSASITSDTASRPLDGTSMAAPHVAGAAAAYLGSHPGSTPAQVATALATGGVQGRVTDPKGSPNVLLQTRFIDTTPPTAAITSPASGATVPASFVVAADVTDPNLERVDLAIDGTLVGTLTAGPYQFSVSGLGNGSHTLTLSALDYAGQATISTLTVTVGAGGGDPDGDDDGSGNDVSAGCSSGGGLAGLPVLLGFLAVLGLRRRHKAGLSRVGIVALVALTSACMVGSEGDGGTSAGTRFVDRDGDGNGDGVDTDGDGVADYNTPSCPTCTPGGTIVCSDPIVDTDGDGYPEGLDLDCDGVIDIPFDTGGGGGGGGGGGTVGQTSCVSVIAVNNDKRSIECTSENGGPSTCSCERNDQLEKTCTTDLASPCDMSYPTVAGQNCCGY